MYSKRIHFADETLFPKKSRNYDVKKYRKELENQIQTSNQKKKLDKIMRRSTPKKITQIKFDNFEDNYYDKKNEYFDTLMNSMHSSIKNKNKIYDKFLITKNNKNKKKKNKYNDFFQIKNSCNFNSKKLKPNQTCENWKNNDSITNYIDNNKKIKTQRRSKKKKEFQRSVLTKNKFNNTVYIDEDVKNTLLNQNKFKNNFYTEKDIENDNNFYLNDEIENNLTLTKNSNFEIEDEINNNFQTKNYNKFYTKNREDNLFISDFNENIEDVLKSRKLEERKKKFENYVKQDLPNELNKYIKNYFDCSFVNFQKEIQKNQKSLNDELLEFKNFTNVLQKGEERAYHDLKNLKREMKTLQKCELDRRYKVYESLNNNSKVHFPKKKFSFKNKNTKSHSNYYDYDNNYKKEYSVKDILDSFENLINY